MAEITKRQPRSDTRSNNAKYVKSVVARVTDECGTTSLDLSTGLANALEFTSGAVTISKP